MDHVPDIARHYRKTWLPFDLFCVVPIEWICLGWATDYAFYLQLRQVVRVARFASLARSGNPLHERRQWMALLTYVAVVALLVHCAALVFQAIGTDEPKGFGLRNGACTGHP